MSKNYIKFLFISVFNVPKYESHITFKFHVMYHIMRLYEHV